MDDAEISRRIAASLTRWRSSFEQSGFEAWVSCNPNAGSTLRLDDLTRLWDRAVRQFQRAALTVVVEVGHVGPIVVRQTPTEGTFIECSWVQANQIHQQWPLKLSKVLAADTAEFVPLSSAWGEWAPRTLPLPPYEAMESRGWDEGV